jgi:hypothetical protein
MKVTIQFTDPNESILEVAHKDFYHAIKGLDIYRFSIGTADFYNHDRYALEDDGESLLVSEWNPPGAYPEGPHACVYQVFSPEKWLRTQYGEGCEIPYEQFLVPKEELKIVGVLVEDSVSDQLRIKWPITKLEDYSRLGI